MLVPEEKGTRQEQPRLSAGVLRIDSLWERRHRKDMLLAGPWGLSEEMGLSTESGV